MNNLSRFAALSAFLALAATLSAQPSDGTRGHHGRGGHGGPGRGHPMVRVLDNDMDRELSATELANAPSNLRALDLNADGNVSADELHPARPARAEDDQDRPARPVDANRPVPPIMLALDANADGALSTTEIANATTSLNALDLNADGKLTADEFLPTPPAGKAPGGRGHGRGRPTGK